MTNILTLALDPHSQAHFDHQRKTHYPPELNQIAAHLTLFHTLPDTPEVVSALEAHRQHPAFSLQVTGLQPLGKGVAYRLASTDLQALHASLAAGFMDHLTPQDRQPFRPHVVIQNKVTPGRARTLLAELQQSFQPFEVQATGLDLWHYLGGPWQHAGHFPFNPQPLPAPLPAHPG